MRPSAPASATAVVVALLLAACGGASGQDDAADRDRGPVTAYVTRLLATVRDAEGIERQHRETEEAIARCMAELGFEYVPEEPRTRPGKADQQYLDMESVEFAEEFGYGLTTNEELYGIPVEGWTDPNAEQVAAMSEAEAQAWDDALWGPPHDEEAEPEDGWQMSGCTGRAWQEADDDSPLTDETLTAALDEYAEAEAALVHDPALQGAVGRWAECMADEGHDVEDLPDARAIVDELWYALPVVDETDPTSTTTRREAEAAKAELKDTEIAVAVADATCREESGYAAARAARLRAAEERVWATYGDRLEQLSAEVEAPR